MKKRIACALLGLFLIISPVMAVFGVGDIVHDPISYANAILMLSELVKSYEQLKAQLELQVWMSQTVPVEMSLRYRVLGSSWYGMQTPYDHFENLGGWTEAVNQGGSAIDGYNTASVPLQQYGQSFYQLATEQQTKVMSHYASAELIDGSNIHSMEVLGMLRGNASAVDESIQALEDDSLSLDPSMNTEVAVLNKINAASIASLRSARDTNRALVSVLEQGLVESKLKRDAQVGEINAQILRLELGPQMKAQGVSTLTQSLSSFRWRQ